jgi:MinD superfamily P-loop ATPase
LLFLSGKGGTGKTTLAGAFAVLADDKILVDCDVDAANLHLLLDPEVTAEGAFEGSKVAVRNSDRCTACGSCRDACRFNAIGAELQIDPFSCEGCGVCAFVCPAEALQLEPRVSGHWATSETRYGPLASAELEPGEETSGKLVMVVKRKADELAEQVQAERSIVDGAPGIGCPVIASVSGVHVVVLVTEPSLSGIHDLKRILEVIDHFRVPSYLVLNKADLSEEAARRVEEFAVERDLPLLGQIPYDKSVTELMVVGESAVDNPASPAGLAMRAIFERLGEEIDGG